MNCELEIICKDSGRGIIKEVPVFDWRDQRKLGKTSVNIANVPVGVRTRAHSSTSAPSCLVELCIVTSARKQHLIC
jgi:hypothetical protein